ncbi:MAG: ATP-dependent helicase [Candidatus Micrarchaeia archaeon]
MDYGKHLNPEQLQIVEEGDGAVLVVAGPGSGKTRTLVYRVCRLLERGEPPSSILLLTFTNRAAREMKSRAESLIGPDGKRITAGTFHHFANILLRRNGDLAGLGSNFTILDEEDSKSLLKAAVLSFHETVKKNVVDSIKSAISLSKLRMCPIEAVFEDPEFFHLRNHAEEVGKIAAAYEKMKRSDNVVDFDDLLVHAHTLLELPKIRDACRARYRHILVDEFQDTDRLQASIVALLHSEGAGLMAVGDDSQSIYSFRGAEIRNILEFREKYGAKVFFLVRNYRSTPPIVSLINSTIKSSKVKIDKQLVPVESSGAVPSVHEFIDRDGEANFIAESISTELKGGRRIGVLFRAAYLASELEIELSRRGISYDMRGGVKFFEQRHVKDLVSLLKAYNNPKDRTSVTRLLMLFPRIGEKGVMKVIGGISAATDVPRALSALERSGEHSALLRGIFQSGGNGAAMLDMFYISFYKKYMEANFDDHEERKADVEALLGAAAGFPSVGEFLEAFSLDPDSPKAESRPVVLSTIHQAKGLEWDSVYILGLADGLLPLARSNDAEEERRLFYVAASRARRNLVMTYSVSSGRFYGHGSLEPSRFLRELPDSLYIRGGDKASGENPAEGDT